MSRPVSYTHLDVYKRQGIYADGSVKSAEGYSLGGRSAGVPMVAGRIAGTIIGGGATVGTAQLAYSAGLSAWWFSLGSVLTFIIMGLFYAGPLRKTCLLYTSRCV